MDVVVENLLKNDLKSYEKEIKKSNEDLGLFSILTPEILDLHHKRKNLMCFLNDDSIFKKEEGPYCETFKPLIPLSIFHNGFPVDSFIIDMFDDSINVFYVSGGFYVDSRVVKEYDYSKKLEVSTRMEIEL